MRFHLSARIIEVTAWLLFFSLPLLFMYGSKSDENESSLWLSPYYWQFCLVYFFCSFLNTKILVPKFLLQKKFGLYGLSVMLLLLSIYFIQPFDKLLNEARNLTAMAVPLIPDQHSDRPPDDFPPDVNGNRPPPGPPITGRSGLSRSPIHDITSLYIFAVIMTLSTATVVLKQWQVTERRAARAEMEKAKAELSFLKAQINPHFLFNTLNNIYALAVTKNEKTADSIMKLSNIMRFVTDDVQEETVSLDREIACIKDYIELQQLRVGKNTQITLDVTGDTIHKKISPLLLLTFVENAFKHGISKRLPSSVSIKIAASEDSIYFHCQNSTFHNQTPQERTGLGIENTKQRLEYIYPESHHLMTKRDKNFFTVELEIKSL